MWDVNHRRPQNLSCCNALCALIETLFGSCLQITAVNDENVHACNLCMRLHAKTCTHDPHHFASSAQKNLKLMHIFFSTPTPFKCHLDISKTLDSSQRRSAVQTSHKETAIVASVSSYESACTLALCCDLELHTCAAPHGNRSYPLHALFQTFRN